MTTFVIIGAGLAGAKAAQTLRDEGFDGDVVLLGAESERPYERPPLSKGYLQGRSEREKVFVHTPEWYAEHSVDLRQGATAVALDRDRRVVELDGGGTVAYDKALIATGATPRALKVPGADLAGVRTLRTIPDSEALREAFAKGGRVVIAGAGWIGLETAAAARAAGCEVTVVEPEPTPLHRVLGRELGEVYAGVHRRNGVEFRFGTGVAEIGGGDRVREVVTAEGERLPADLVVVGIGAAPNVGLAVEAGLDVNDGIVVDASLRSSDPHVYAAGDVAEAFNPLLGRHIRVEHWANALNGGPAAARAMLGQEVVYDRVPYFYTDQFELGMEFSGDIQGYDRVVYRGSVEELSFIAFWLRDNHVLAGMNVNIWDVTGPIQALIRSGRPVDPDALADPSRPLDGLAG
ncbi:3-phenylpropionate/trans-cinnamate dioxygenase ferredoxin reductase subunit [Sinosporangium album]|uniref:3-phenylpropionate/trans-cinnamate dioxygenase ferredoxin reductase subunit n=1 Tax=Sinosporangium album TaxID=504805 RepID=A0A1G7S9Q8_9ACTN|nr:FAD-dependent oxidoreductase [Sinosporangium album]SDG19738.1 3-phenylpropionate/trans-cinnamate dioxygenase ferredoxin reductase subunit [Sinosporangium album]